MHADQICSREWHLWEWFIYWLLNLIWLMAEDSTIIAAIAIQYEQMRCKCNIHTIHIICNLPHCQNCFSKPYLKKCFVEFRYPYFIMRMVGCYRPQHASVQRNKDAKKWRRVWLLLGSSRRGPRDTMLSRSKRNKVTAISDPFHGCKGVEVVRSLSEKWQCV